MADRTHLSPSSHPNPTQQTGSLDKSCHRQKWLLSVLLTARWTFPGEESSEQPFRGSKQGAGVPGPPHHGVRRLLLHGHQLLQDWPHCAQPHVRRQQYVTDSREWLSRDRGPLHTLLVETV